MSNLVPFDFYGDRLDVIANGQDIRIGIRPVCAALELDYSTQLKKLKSKSWACVGLSPMQIGGQRREIATLGLDALPMWLATIEVKNVAAKARPKLERFQLECARILADHFLGPRSTVSPAQIREEAVAEAVRAMAGESGTIRGSRYFATECKGLLASIARNDGVSFQRAHGALRTEFKVVSYLDVRFNGYGFVREWLVARLANQPGPLLEKAEMQLNIFSLLGNDAAKRAS